MLLAPYRVLDATGPLGFMTGRVFAELGADVIKIEPPGGDPSRAWAPLGGPEGSRTSLMWLALNAGKRGITLDFSTCDGRRRFRQLAATADFLLETFEPGTLARRGLDYEALAQKNPALIHVSITPFGSTGPYATHRASDLEIWAVGGAMSLAGEEEGEPMRVSVPQSPMWVGVEAAMGALTALAYRAVTGRGQHVDVSAQAAVMAAIAHAPAFWDLNGVNPQRAGVYVTGRSTTGAKMRVFWRCRDGWINFIIYGGGAGRRTNRQLVAWMDELGLAPPELKAIDWSTFSPTGLSQAEVDALEAPVERFMATLSKREFFEGAVTREMLGYPVQTVEDIYEDRQLASRGFWQDIADPSTGKTLKYPGGFAVVDGQRLRIPRPAPTIGQHNDEIFDGNWRDAALAAVAPLSRHVPDAALRSR
jgi:crotonobetainyl-CoA:carnitine CoA-transferase CaiB-like acyl-CoA transferase